MTSKPEPRSIFTPQKDLPLTNQSLGQSIRSLAPPRDSLQITPADSTPRSTFFPTFNNLENGPAREELILTDSLPLHSNASLEEDTRATSTERVIIREPEESEEPSARNEDSSLREGIDNAPKGLTSSFGKGKGIQPSPQQVPPLTSTPPVTPSKETCTSKHRLSDEHGLKSNAVLERPKKRPLTSRSTINSQVAEFGSPQSPLFFSHTSRKRPLLPPGLSSSITAEMLNRGKKEETVGVTTLKLARGSLSNTSTSRSSGASGSFASIEKASIARSPEPKRRSPGMQILGSVGITELLEQDDRPTFIIDVANPINFIPGGALVIVFANASLRGHEVILDMITGGDRYDGPRIVNDFSEFKGWVLSFVKNNEAMDVSLPSFTYGGINWSCSTLRKRLRLISGSGSIIASGVGGSTSSYGANIDSPRVGDDSQALLLERSPPPIGSTEGSDYFGDVVPSPNQTPALPQSSKLSPMSLGVQSPPSRAMIAAQNDALTSDMLMSRYPDNPSFDWTRLPLSAALPKHIQFARSIDWASTPLGPIENWAFDLRAMCNLIMGSPHPAAMYWGDEYIAIYNEAYIMLAGKKHPELMGQSYKTAWAEIWSNVADVFASAKHSGQSTMKDDDCLFINRNGFLEESYFSWSIIPLIGEDGSVVGLYNPAFDKTRRKIAERRMLTLREIGDKTAAAREVKSFWGQVIKGLEYNEYDVPFCLLYSVTDDSDSEVTSMHSGSLSQSPQCVLEGTIGVPKGHRSSVSPLELKASDDGFAPYLRESMKTDKPVLLKTSDGTLSFDLIEGLECRGFGDPCRAVVVCPIHPTTGDSILGFLVMGVNPRRPFDDDYSLFIQLLSRQLATSMASVVLFEEEIRRGQRAAQLAALDRQELSKQLDLRTQEKVESETKFTRMAEFAPVGMFIANSIGKITYSNDTWWEITRHPRSVNSADTWMDSIKSEDREGVEQIWTSLVDQKTAVTHEFRFKTPWQDRNGNMTDTWVLMSAFPEKDEHGKLKSVFGSITNISSQKSAEGLQKQRMEEAIELKRQQENFIDMTSHEMRNPLSAILQCSEEISSSLVSFLSQNEHNGFSEKLREMLDGGIDAAQTIALCAQHQKRIVDDILTLSKLDSALLMVTPVKVHPVEVVQRALKMFEGELETNDISLEFRIEKSYLDLQVDTVKLDPSRLLQVLINLTTNAIKFTHTQKKRTIIVSIGASIERPTSSESGVTYFPSRRAKAFKDVTEDAEWGTGENIFLLFAVEDTGRGLDAEEKKILFQRFRQASPRTHVQYGGSGLGLFISRELTELQGGEIGVASERNVGSTFSFYIRARKVETDPSRSAFDKYASLRRKSSNSAVVVENKRGSSRSASRSTTPNKPGTPAPAPTTLFNFEAIKVLIVEDNLVNQRVLQKQLKNIGFHTSVANHGGEALDIIRKSSFWRGREKDGAELTLILMDLEMPVMDGLTATRKIREFEKDGTILRHLPIIAVTANARLEQIDDAMGAGMDDVVSKPFRIAELIPKIQELVAKSASDAIAAALVSPTLDEHGPILK